MKKKKKPTSRQLKFAELNLTSNPKSKTPSKKKEKKREFFL